MADRAAAATAARPPVDRRRIAILVATALAIQLLYWVVASAGTFTHIPQPSSYLDDLADGFRQGHLHLAVEPAAALLAKANPRDPANVALWYWDASLFGGHYYLYWGPVPALLLAAVKTIFRIHTGVGDQHVVFWLTTLQLLAGTLLVERLARRLFDRPPLALEVAAIVAVGCANPILYNLARPAVYEAAIVGGQAFVLLGMVLALDAVCAEAVRPGRLAAAGAAWAAAFGCRISLGPAIALLALVTLGAAIAGRPGRGRRLAATALWLGAPLALGLFAMLLYNKLRFAAWFDFGQRHQLTWIDTRVGARFIATNLYAYLRRAPILSCRFPFAFALQDIGARAFPPGYVLPADYFVYEPVAGLLPTVPWCWLALPALFGAARTVGRTRRLSPRGWAVAACAVVAAVGLGPALVLATATNRYLGDVVGVVAVLGALGAFTVDAWLAARRRARRSAAAGALALAALTAALGVGLGVRGQYGHFEVNNPGLHGQLVRRLSLCRGEIPPEPN